VLKLRWISHEEHMRRMTRATKCAGVINGSGSNRGTVFGGNDDRKKMDDPDCNSAVRIYCTPANLKPADKANTLRDTENRHPLPALRDHFRSDVFAVSQGGGDKLRVDRRSRTAASDFGAGMAE